MEPRVTNDSFPVVALVEKILADAPGICTSESVRQGQGSGSSITVLVLYEAVHRTRTVLDSVRTYLTQGGLRGTSHLTHLPKLRPGPAQVVAREAATQAGRFTHHPLTLPKVPTLPS
ncbi:hypothetical protein PZA11_001572 [Diplocarpon coronariae]